MQVVVLAGGAGRRITTLVADKPKSMFEFLGRPLLFYTLSVARNAGLHEMIIVYGTNGEIIKDYFEDGSDFGISIEYVHQKQPSGMGDALLAARGLIKNDFILINANDLVEVSAYENLLREKRGSRMILTGKEVSEPWKFGILDIENGHVKKIVEKPKIGEEPSKIATISPYLIPLIFFNYLGTVKPYEYSLEAAIQAFIDDSNEVNAVLYHGFFASLKFPEDADIIKKYLQITVE
jgi:dTDP-glucose pyrophosphorylase